MERKTKIICTLGPATDDQNLLERMCIEGMNVARFNFSHGSHEEHKARLTLLKEARKHMNKPVAALMDTRGPEIRLGKFKNGTAALQAGQEFVLLPEDCLGDTSHASISYSNLYQDITPGTPILIDDGLIEMEVTGINNRDIHCRIKNGGIVSDQKGINVPNIRLSMPFIDDKDKSDILFAARQGFDFIAASFTRSADDILQIRDILKSVDCTNIRIIAKIENKQGLDHINEILHVSDGIMIARGDMGVELPFEDIPIIQKKLVKKSYLAGKQVIIATQMLNSMMSHPRPTRAEVTDVANAVYSGTSAVMLSGETAAGKYPVESLQTMSRICKRTEEDIDYAGRLQSRNTKPESDITNAIAHATCMTAMDLDASAIISISSAGLTARMVSKYRPQNPIIGVTSNPQVLRQMNLSWGVIPIQTEAEKDADIIFQRAVERSVEEGLISYGDTVVLTAGMPLGISGTTNQIRVLTVTRSG